MQRPNTNWHLLWKCTGTQPRSVSLRDPPPSPSVLLLGMICACIEMWTANSFSFNLLNCLEGLHLDRRGLPGSEQYSLLNVPHSASPFWIPHIKELHGKQFHNVNWSVLAAVNRYPESLQRG